MVEVSTLDFGRPVTLCSRCGREFIDFCKPCAAQSIVSDLKHKGALRGVLRSRRQSRQARAKALIALDDPELATKIALTDDDMHMRRAALMLVRDKNILMEVAYTDEDWRVREIAIRCLKDATLLKEIINDHAVESTNHRFAEECLRNLKC